MITELFKGSNVVDTMSLINEHKIDSKTAIYDI